jgi:glycosyltransferase involved in cell wall biosynthesis
MIWPLVSVIIPAHNAGRYLRECIDSVLSQSYPSLEIIVVDDGSTDDTPRIMSEFGDRIVAIRQDNAGAAAARNAGLFRARGKYIAFLDADDVWRPDKLERQVEVLEASPDVGVVFSRWMLWYPNSDGTYPPMEAISEPAVGAEISSPDYADLLLDCTLFTSTVVMRREVVNRIGGFAWDLRRGQDYDYWLRASRVTRIKSVELELALYRMDNDAIAKKAGGVNWELQVVSRAVSLWGNKAPNGRTVPMAKLRRRFWALSYQFGYVQFKQRSFRLAAKAFATALRYRPLHAKTYVYAIASLVGRVVAEPSA